MALKPMVPRTRAATTPPVVGAPQAVVAPSAPAATTTPTATATATATAVPAGLVAHDVVTGELTPTKKIGEFDKSDIAPREVGALVREAFPTPPSTQSTYTPDEQLQALLEAAQKAVEQRAKQLAKDSARAILARTQTMPNGMHAIGVLPPQAVRIFLEALTLGFGIDHSRLPTGAAKPQSVKDAAAMQEAADLSDDDDFEGLGLDDFNF